MIHGTHAAFGAALMETILVAEHAPLTWRAAAAVLIAGAIAPFPDLDHPEAWVTRHVPFAGSIGVLFQHRTLTHGLLLTSILYFGLLLFSAWGQPAWLASGIFVGWVSHWIIDLLNPMGVQLFYPLKIWVKLPRFLTIEVNGLGERILFHVLKTYSLMLPVLYVAYVLPTSYLSAFVFGVVMIFLLSAMPRIAGRKFILVASFAIAAFFLKPSEQAINWAAHREVELITSSPLGAWSEAIHIQI